MSATTHRASFNLQSGLHPSRRIYSAQLPVTTVVVTVTVQAMTAGSTTELMLNGAAVADGVIDANLSRTFALAAQDAAVKTVDLVLRAPAAGGSASGFYDLSVYV